MNGLVLPGGDPWPQVSSGAVRQLYRLALEANNKGDHFPVWGTCAGMQTLMAYAASGCQARVIDGGIPFGTCAVEGPITRGWDSINQTSKLHLSDEARSSRLLGATRMGTVLQQWLEREEITFNYHNGGASLNEFTRHTKLGQMFSVLSTSIDRQNRAYVSTIEGRVYPFYGVQWHPEKAMFEWGARPDGGNYEAINHDSHAMAVARYTASFFAEEARKSTHAFPSAQTAMNASIYTQAPTSYNPQHPM
eukprot:COSAG01_NODE_7509_length_3176_cov_32.916477_3_plen_249_part_00